MSKPKLYVIDISNIIHRAFHVHGDLMNSSGFPTGAIYGTFSILMNWIRDVVPENILICYDWQESATVRKSLYPLYKANRTQVNAVSAQEKVIRRMIEHLGMASREVPGYEADDVIGAAVKKYKEDYNIEIITGDKDLMQLVQSGVTMYDQRKKMRYYHDDVIDKFGVRPDQIQDFLAIVGDKADNIPGVKGVGEKGAVKLLNDFESLEKIYESLDSIKGATRKKLEESKDNAFLSKTLATLYKDISIGDKDIRFKPVYNEELIKLFGMLEFSDNSIFKLNNLWKTYERNK